MASPPSSDAFSPRRKYPHFVLQWTMKSTGSRHDCVNFRTVSSPSLFEVERERAARPTRRARRRSATRPGVGDLGDLHHRRARSAGRTRTRSLPPAARVAGRRRASTRSPRPSMVVSLARTVGRGARIPTRCRIACPSRSPCLERPHICSRLSAYYEQPNGCMSSPRALKRLGEDAEVRQPVRPPGPRGALANGRALRGLTSDPVPMLDALVAEHGPTFRGRAKTNGNRRRRRSRASRAATRDEHRCVQVGPPVQRSRLHRGVHVDDRHRRRPSPAGARRGAAGFRPSTTGRMDPARRSRGGPHTRRDTFSAHPTRKTFTSPVGASLDAS